MATAMESGSVAVAGRHLKRDSGVERSSDAPRHVPLDPSVIIISSEDAVDPAEAPSLDSPSQLQRKDDLSDERLATSGMTFDGDRGGGGGGGGGGGAAYPDIECRRTTTLPSDLPFDDVTAGAADPGTQSPSVSSSSARLTVLNPSKVESDRNDRQAAGEGTSVFPIVVKWLVTILFVAVFLGCLVASKLSAITLGAELFVLRKKSENAAGDLDRATIVLMLLLTLLIPHGVNLVRAVWSGGFRSDRFWPKRSAVLWGLVASVCESAGISLFTLDVLSTSHGYVCVLLMNGVFLVPICGQLVTFCRRPRGYPARSRSLCILVVALLFALTGHVSEVLEYFLHDGAKTNVWEVPVALICLSIAWCPYVQKKQLHPPYARLKEELEKKSEVPKYSATANEARVHHERERFARESSSMATSGSTAITGMSSYASGASGFDSADFPDGHPVDSPLDANTPQPQTDETKAIFTDPHLSARWKIAIITSLFKLILIPGFSLLFIYTLDVADIKTLHLALPTLSAKPEYFNAFLVSLFTSLGGYVIGCIVSTMGSTKSAFLLPLSLATPVTLGVLLLYQTPFLSALKPPTPLMEWTSLKYHLPTAFAFYIAQLLSTGIFIYNTVTTILQKESQLFWLPGYNSVFLEQHMLLSRKNKSTDASIPDPISTVRNTRIYICTTMYREAAHEMEQLLHSIGRVNEAKQVNGRHFDAQVFFDNGVRGTKLTDMALQLVAVAKKALNLGAETCTKVATPYGMTLAWRLPSATKKTQGMILTIHLKDNGKVKNKKRWSQVMYMSYVLDFLMREDETARDEDSFILVTDADIMFTPDSVEALLDLMTRDRRVGAVCARTYPMGSGPVYWYQIFDYAIGHWLQKAANHVLGSVLCCPGCFSVYRVKTVRDVLSTYASRVTKASEFLIKDMGEDRWLCTLMVQAGWRLEYCAASTCSTYCPEEFDEFFKQRRRWVPSSMANLLLLLQEWQDILLHNKHISIFFLLYQASLLVSSLITPSVSILIIVGGMFRAWGVAQSTSTILLVLVTVGFAWICLSCSQETQLKAAKVLTVGFALVMAVVAVGIATQMVGSKEKDSGPGHSTPSPVNRTAFDSIEALMAQQAAWVPHDNSDWRHGNNRQLILGNGREIRDVSDQRLDDNKEDMVTGLPPTGGTTTKPKMKLPMPISSMYLVGLSGIFFVTAALHLSEFYCLLHGIWYLLCLPAGSLVLMIYSICNITDGSWGTREEKKVGNFGKQLSWRDYIKKFFKFFRCWADKDEPSADNSTPKARSVETSGSDPVDDEDGSSSGEGRDDTPGTSVSGTPRRGKPRTGTSRPRRHVERSGSFKFHDEHSDVIPIPVERWLPGRFRALYGEIFKQNGYDDTSFIAGMTSQELNAIGITSVPHVSAIISAVRALPDYDLEPNVPSDAMEWVEMIGLSQYMGHFQNSCIVTRSHLEILRAMGQEDIKEALGITKQGHMKRLLIAIKNLRYPTAEEQENSRVKYEIDELPLYQLQDLRPRESDFWVDLREHRLIPDSEAFAHDLNLKAQLTELRNSVIMAFAVTNSLWLILILTLVTKSELSVLDTDALGFAFLVIFGGVLVLQFLTMLVHRFSTFIHLMARTPMTRSASQNATWSFSDDKLRRPATRQSSSNGSRSDVESPVDIVHGSLEESADMRARVMMDRDNETIRNQFKQDAPKRAKRMKSPALSRVSEESNEATPLIGATDFDEE